MASPADDPALYYSRRAAEYEEVYRKPERQEDLAVLRELLPRLLAGRRVLELACGTGYWTEVIAPAAAAVLATDLSPEMLALAASKALEPGSHWDRRGLPGVSFRLLDAYRVREVAERFDAVFAGFWWSHVPLAALPAFLASLRETLESGGRFAFLDNRYVAGSSTPVCRQDGMGDTYQLRTLKDGSTYEVLKNFPSADEVRRALSPVAAEVEVTELPYYWLARGRFR